MSESQYQPPLHIDPFAIALDVFGVMDSTCRCVGQFDTLKEAEAFVAEQRCRRRDGATQAS